MSSTDTGLDLIANNAVERWSVHVADGSVPRLASGMIWRSYCDEGSAIPLTRLNMRANFEALDAFETAIRARTSATNQP